MPASCVDVGSECGKAGLIAGEEALIVVDPFADVCGIEAGVDDVEDVSVVGSFVGGAGCEEFIEISVWSEVRSSSPIEREIHVPREIQSFSVAGPEVEDRVVL